jgi:hypothetical protein
MSAERDQVDNLDLNEAPPTPQEETEALQQAMRRDAATREELPDTDGFSDSANRGSMGPQGSGQGKHSGRD